MSHENRRTLLTIGITLLVGLTIYGIAQGSGLSSIVTESTLKKAPDAVESAPQKEAPKAVAPVIVVQQTVEFPSGAVMYFNLSACPDGWTKLTAAQGRYIVGLLDGGTLAGTAGTAFTTNGENRAVGQHNHTANDPGHGHTVTEPGHNHAVNDSGHDHDINDPKHEHSYLWPVHNGTDTGDDRWVADDQDEDTDNPKSTTQVDTGITVLSNPTGITLGNNTTGLSVNNSATGVTVDNAGSVVSTNAPYIQLLVCQKD